MSGRRLVGIGRRLAVVVLALFGTLVAAALALDYRLNPVAVGKDSYVFIGEREDFSVRNGGNIVNTAFVVTADGVVVIDTGSTRRYGEAMRAAIARITDQPIREVWITHHHPDHFLGNQAYADRPIAALAGSSHGMRDEGQSFASNVYRMTGDWAKGTEPLAPGVMLTAGTRDIGGHRFRLLALAGHTAADLAVFDETTGILYSGDLVFHDRAPTTPHADIPQWLNSLDQLAALPFRTVVPGHGLPAADDGPIRQTRAWLTWLVGMLQDSANRGFDPTEILERPLPKEFATMPLAREELARSITHLYRSMELRAISGTAAGPR